MQRAFRCPQACAARRGQLRQAASRIRRQTSRTHCSREDESDRPPPRSVLFNASLKSASTYITATLAQGLGAERAFITVGVFPGDLILFDKVQRFAAGGQVAQQHFPASPENLAYLRRFSLPVIVHARDPRAVIVSWTHHLAAAPAGLDELFWYYPAICPPAQFLRRPFGWQLEWCLEHHLVHFINWLQGWIDAAEHGDAAPLFTTFEAFVRDRTAFLAAVLAKAGVPPEAFADPGFRPDERHLFRRGLLDEWRTAMDANQARKATATIPPSLWKVFGWYP